MDRTQALDILDSLAPDGTPDAPEVQEALRLLEADPEGRRQLETRRSLALRDRLDHQIGRVLADVPVPVGARQRLLSRLAAASPSEARLEVREASSEPEALSASQSTSPAPPPAGKPARSRGWRIGRIVSATAALLVVVALAWQFAPTPKIPVEAAIQAEIPNVAELPLFTGRSFQPAFPEGWQDRLQYDARADGTPQFYSRFLGPRGQTEAAVCGFRAWSRNRTVEGYLLVLPARRVTNPPAETSFATAPDLYNGAFAYRTWTAGDHVYVCVVRNGEAGLHLLKRLLDVGVA